MLSLASEMQKTRKTTFRLQATDKKHRKLAFARKRNEKNAKNNVSLVSEEQKTVKTGFRLCFFQQIDPKRAFLLAFFYLNINFLNLKTMELHQIYYSRLQNMEHFQFASHVAALCDEANIELVNAVLEPLKQAIEQEDKALNLPRQEEGTKELEQLDRARDQAYRALQLLTELNLQDDDSATQTAAQRISEVLSRYPKVIQS